jgi:hypothetical protein
MVAASFGGLNALASDEDASGGVAEHPALVVQGPLRLDQRVAAAVVSN